MAATAARPRISSIAPTLLNASFATLASPIAAHADDVVAVVDMPGGQCDIVAWESVRTPMAKLAPPSAFARLPAEKGEHRLLIQTPGRTDPGADASFSLSVAGQATAPLQADSSAADVEAAIDALSTAPPGLEVQRTMTPGATAFVIRYDATGEPLAMALDTLSAAVGTTATVEVISQGREAQVGRDPSARPALPVLVASGARHPSVSTEGRCRPTALQVSPGWVAAGRPGNGSSAGHVVLWRRLAASGVSAARVIAPAAGGAADDATAIVTQYRPWNWTQSSAGAAPGLGGQAAAAIPAAEAGGGFGHSIGLDGDWLIVGYPNASSAAFAGVQGPAAPQQGGFAIFALGTEAPPVAPVALLAASGSFAPADVDPALSGPHPGAPLAAGLPSLPARCGASVSIGGGFAAVACPGLSVAGAPGSGGVLVLRSGRALNKTAVDAAWPRPAPASAVGLSDLRSDASEAVRTPAEPVRGLATSVAWTAVQLLVPRDAEAGDGAGAAGLAVSSRFVVAAAAGRPVVFAWRRRNGMAPAFDPSSQQTLTVPAAITGGISLSGHAFIATLSRPVDGAVAAVFAADALGIFHGKPGLVAAERALLEGEAHAVLAANTSVAGCTAAALAVARPVGATPDRSTRRAVLACASPQAGPAVVGVVDAAGECPRLDDAPAAPVAFESVALLRGLGAAPPGECASVPAELAEAPWSPPSGSNATAPALALGAGDPRACVMACDAGHVLASGSQVARCGAASAWSLLPDELPLCEHLLDVARPAAPPAGSPPVPAAQPPAGSHGPAVALRDVSDRGPTIAAVRFSAATLGLAAQGRVPRAAGAPPGAKGLASVVASAIGALRARDGSFSAARLREAVAPVLAGQAPAPLPGPTPAPAPLNVSAFDARAMAVLEASGGQGAANASATDRDGRLAAALASAAVTAAAARPSLPGTLADFPQRAADANAVLGGLAASLLLSQAQAAAASDERLEPRRGARFNATACAAGIGDAPCAPTVEDGATMADSALTGVTSPLGQWRAPALTLDPLAAAVAAPARRVPPLAASRPEAVRAGMPPNASQPWTVEASSTKDVAGRNPQNLAALEDPAAPVAALRLPNSSRADADPSASAGGIVLGEGDLLASEALLAPMTWHGGSQYVGVGLEGRGGPALAGAPIFTALGLRVCCSVGRGREPYDEGRGAAGPLVSTVRVVVEDSYPFAVSSGLPGMWSGPSLTFLDALLARVSLRLGNVSGALAFAGHAVAVRSRPGNGSALALDGMAPPWMHQKLGAGTAALDVPGASVELVSGPSSVSDAYGMGTTGAHPATGRQLPSPQGVVFDLKVSGFGHPPADAPHGGCADMEPASSSPPPAEAEPLAPGQARASPHLALVRTRLGPSRTMQVTLTAGDADRLAKAVLRAAGQPLSWWERRRCVAGPPS